jgi:serine/threonine protein kinase
MEIRRWVWLLVCVCVSDAPRHAQWGNVVIYKRRIMLIDFGQSVTLDARNVDDVGHGTRGYAAPERAAHELPTPASDMFSVGAMMHMCLDAAPALRPLTAQLMSARAALRPRGAGDA